MVQMLALLALSLVRSHFFHSQFPIAVYLYLSLARYP